MGMGGTLSAMLDQPMQKRTDPDRASKAQGQVAGNQLLEVFRHGLNKSDTRPRTFRMQRTCKALKVDALPPQSIAEPFMTGGAGLADGLECRVTLGRGRIGVTQEHAELVCGLDGSVEFCAIIGGTPGRLNGCGARRISSFKEAAGVCH